MTRIGYIALGFCTLAGMLGGYAGFDFVATKTGLKEDIAKIRSQFDDDDDEADIMVQMAAQNRAEAGDPLQ